MFNKWSVLSILFMLFAQTNYATVDKYYTDIRKLTEGIYKLSSVVNEIEILGEKIGDGEVLEEDIKQQLRRLSIMQDGYNNYLGRSILLAYPKLTPFDVTFKKNYVEEMTRTKTEIGLLSFILLEEYVSFLDLLYQKNKHKLNIGQDALYETVFYDSTPDLKPDTELNKIKVKIHDSFQGMSMLIGHPVFAEMFEFEDSFNVLKVTLSVLRPKVRQEQLKTFGIESDGKYIDDAKSILSTFIESFEIQKNCQQIMN